MLQELLELTSHHHITKAYRRIPDQLHNAGGQNDVGNQWKVIFLFQSMNIPGLAVNHEDILRDINRTLNWLIANQKPRYVHNLIQKTFSILKVNATRFPSTSVTCVDNMGREIFQTGNRELIDYFIDAVIDLGFQPPMIRGVGNDWQIQSNGAHIQNIRTWMNLIQLQPGKSMRLFSNLIIHLAVSGVFIKDTDLFGRDITRFFNSGIAEVYNLCKQLARLFPVYFNDIGAEGDLRDISTRIDEICHRRDPLIHFLRKQSHVESSNRIIGFMDAILHFWKTKDKDPLAPYIPPNIFMEIDTQGDYIDGLHKIINALSESGVDTPAALLSLPTDELEESVNTMADVSEADRKRAVLFAELYKQLNNKYNLSFINIGQYVNQLPPEAFPKIKQLKIHLLRIKSSSLIGQVEENKIKRGRFEFARQVNRTPIRVLADFYHMDEENEPLAHLAQYKDWIAHIHVADTGRRAPGTGKYPYEAFAEQLRQTGYDGMVSVECFWDDPSALDDFSALGRLSAGIEEARRSVQFLRRILG